MTLVDQPWSCLALNTQDTIWDLGGYIMLAVYEKETLMWSWVKVTVGILWLLLCSLNTYCLSICCKQFVFLLISSFRKAVFFWEYNQCPVPFVEDVRFKHIWRCVWVWPVLCKCWVSGSRRNDHASCHSMYSLGPVRKMWHGKPISEQTRNAPWLQVFI